MKLRDRINKAECKFLKCNINNFVSIKVVLFLFVFKIFLFGIYWFIQQDNVFTNKNYKQQRKQDNFVNFITKQNNNAQHINFSIESLYIQIVSQGRFEDDFYIFTESGPELKQNISCYRHGTIFKNADKKRFFKNISKCHCKSEWHGRNCAQPEIIWRALMTSKIRKFSDDLRISEQSKNKIIYMISGYFISLDILQIQLLELSKVVDFFILCQRSIKKYNLLTETYRKKQSIAQKLKIKISKELNKRILILDYLSFSTLNKSLKNSKFCTPEFAYKKFKSKLLNLNNLKQNDIFVFSQEDEILNQKAVKYFQYINDFPVGVIRFRLKYNVYGFFWQHPEETKISSALCSIRDLEKMFKSDPDRLTTIKKPSLLIGDLNHIGGWYCRYCYQSSEIVDKIIIESSLPKNEENLVSPNNLFPKQVKNGQINFNYIQNLIADGLFIDGKLGLLKQSRYSDKYYSPRYVENNSWRFNHILVNMFVSFNDDYDY